MRLMGTPRSILRLSITMVSVAIALLSCRSLGPDRTATSADAPTLDEAHAILDRYARFDAEFQMHFATNRFQEAGAVTVTPMLPDSAYCTMYFSLAEGSYCFRAHKGEPFATRRLEPFEEPGGAAVRAMLRDVWGDGFAARENRVLIRERVESPAFTCASTFVWQIMIPEQDITLESFDRHVGEVHEAMHCRFSTTGFGLTADVRASFVLWDVVGPGAAPLIIVERTGNEIGWLELYQLQDSGPVLIASRDLYAF